MRLISLVLLLSGCTFSIGLTYTPDDEIENPLGVIRGDRQFSEHFYGSCEHISSAFEKNDVVSLDHCGVFYKF